MLNKEHYCDNNWFEFEKKHIFNKSWIFVCLKTDLSENNDFITIKIGSQSIVVQNFHGELVAFQNICAHRFKRIQTVDSGNRILMCEYHGWYYDKNGIPKVPKRNTFDTEQLLCKKLLKYQLDICGDFIFVNLNLENNIKLVDYLGEFHQDLIEISENLGLRIGEEKINHLGNWKLLVENVLEGYHCPLIHQDSLIKAGYCIDTPVNLKFGHVHSSWHSPLVKENSSEVNYQNKLKFLEARTFKHESFYHIFIFPNLFISSTSGNLFYIGKLKPLSTKETILSASFYSSRYITELSNKEKSLLFAFNQLNFSSGINVIMEDVPMIESCQQGLEENNHQTGILSLTEEIRIIHFHNSLKNIYESK